MTTHKDPAHSESRGIFFLTFIHQLSPNEFAYKKNIANWFRICPQP